MTRWPEIDTAPAMALELREHAVTLDDERTAAKLVIAANMISRLYGLLVATEDGERQALEERE